MLRNIKLTLEYDGTNYCGFQIQGEVPTVQLMLEKVLERILKEKVSLIASARTDTGVHALEQIVNFKTSRQISVDGLIRGLNSLLPKDIRVNGGEEVPLSFNARQHTVSRLYRYYILNRDSAFCRYHYVYRPSLKVELMQEAARYFIGENDFSAFCHERKDYKTCWRRILRLDCFRQKEEIIVEIEANAFLRQMVRIIIGTLLLTGREKIKVEEIQRIIASKDRTMAGPTVPPEGLFLVAVKLIENYLYDVGGGKSENEVLHAESRRN